MSFKRTSTRRFLPRAAKPSREWVALPTTALSVTSGGSNTTSLLALEAPTLAAGTPVTADAPEDLILDRIIGTIGWTSSAAITIGVGILVVDRSWGPTGSTAITPDLDKRFLWWREFDVNAADILQTLFYQNAGGFKEVNSVPMERDPTFFDLSPKVRLEAGKQLVCAIYQSAASNVTAVTRSIRILIHRAGRR